MPMYDRRCTECKAMSVDLWEPISQTEGLPCLPLCTGRLERIISSHSVTSDDIPGGIWIEHGICHADGSPKKYYSKSEMTKAAKAAGLVQGAFIHDSPHGRRWV